MRDFSMTFAVFHDYPGLEYGLPNSMTFHEFPGPVVTLDQANTGVRVAIVHLLATLRGPPC